MAVAFLLLTLLVQVAFAVAARNAAEGAVGAAARRAARPGADVARVEAQLANALAASLPGMRRASESVEVAGGTAYAQAEISWEPPGPGWATLTFRVAARVPVLEPP